ncbi:MAG TPA: DMT family transporter [Candidatus Sulfotelmatobacter sp.]|nr:DMT family transporter [Candidatus Sulfotelmatobacter sp.]
MTGTRPAALDSATGTYGLGSLALVATLSLMWGAGYPAMAVAMRWFEPLTLRCAVMLASGVILLLYAAATGQRLHLPRRQWRDLAVCALFNMTILQIGMTYGVYFVGAGRSSVLIYTMLIWTALFARLLLGEPLSARRIFALGLGAAAVFALLAQDLSDVRDAPLGVVLNLVAAASFGFGTVWTKRTIWSLDLSAMAGWQLVVGVAPLVAIWFVVAPPVAVVAVPAFGWAAFVYMIVGANVLAYLVWFRLVRRLPAAVLGVGTLATPCVGVLSSALINGDAIRPNDAVALALVCGALALVLFEPRPPR